MGTCENGVMEYTAALVFMFLTITPLLHHSITYNPVGGIQ
jgi:hypothetical protein